MKEYDRNPYHLVSFLMEERPPAGPFLSDQKGAKESVKEGDSISPSLTILPLKRPNTGGLRPPYWMYPLGAFDCRALQ